MLYTSGCKPKNPNKTQRGPECLLYLWQRAHPQRGPSIHGMKLLPSPCPHCRALAAGLPAEVSWGILPWNHCSFLCSLYCYILYKPFVILGSSSRLDWLINNSSLWGDLGLKLSPLPLVIYWQVSEEMYLTIYLMFWFSQNRNKHTW